MFNVEVGREVRRADGPNGAMPRLDRPVLEREFPPSYAALLIDYPVLLRAIRQVDADAVPRLIDVVRRAQVLGPLLAARAYGAWYDTDEAQAAFSAGVDPVFVPAAGPGIVPSTTTLIADGLMLVEAGHVKALALSGDDRLLPLITAAHAAGLRVALIAHSCAPDSPCLELAEFAEPATAYARALTRSEKYRRPPAARSA